VHTALTLSHRYGVPDAVVGAVLLAVLTSLPNAYTGVRLGRARRGAALVTETMNSNTINLVGGLAIPALFVALGGFSTLAVVDIAWLLVATAGAILLLGRRSGMGVRAGILLLAVWAGFAVVQGVWG
jgi:cation:H+ antiporter